MTTKKNIRWAFLLSIISLVIYYFFPEQKLPSNSKIDSLVVIKSKRRLKAYSNGKLLKTYKISLGKNPIGDKEFEGDKKRPKAFILSMLKTPTVAITKICAFLIQTKKI